MYKLNNIYIGIVVNNQDWENRGRVQVFIPHLTNTLYKGWNESGEDIKFKSVDSSVFTPDIISRLTEVLPWSEVTMPFFGGGTGAPVNQDTGTPTPAPTYVDPTTGLSTETSKFPMGKNNYDLNAIVNNSNSGNSGSYFNGLSVSGDVKNLNSTYAQRLAGFANELQSAGYKVNINSGYRAPTMTEKKQIGSSGTDQETLYNQNHGVGTAKPYESNHGFGIAADVVISGSGRFGDVDITRISTSQNKYNKTSPELNALKQKWGLHTPLGNEAWHFEPIETGITGNGFQTANSLNNNNIAAFSGSGAAQTGVASTNQFPKKDGMNSSSGEVTSSETISAGKAKLAADRQAKFTQELNDPETMKNLAYLSNREVGSNPAAQRAWMETVFNRALFGNTSLKSQLQGNLGYWTQEYPDFRDDPKYKNFDSNSTPAFTENINKILAGSNLTNLATDNASNIGSNTLADNRIKAGVTGSWMKDGVVVPAGTKGAEFLYRGDGVRAVNGEIPRSTAGLNATKYANANGLVSDNGVDTTQPANIMKPTDMFQNTGNGLAKIGGAGTAMGLFSIPQVGSKAFVMFLDGNPLKPIVVGCYQEPSNIRSA